MNQLTFNIPDGFEVEDLLLRLKPIRKAPSLPPPDTRVIDTTAEAIDDDNVVRLADWKAA